MAGKLYKSIRLYIRQEPGHDRWQRMWICALIGILAATIFAWTMSTINLITLPRQHLGMDWNRLWFYWGGLGLIAGLEGLFVGWFTENYEGIAYGWMPLEFLLLLSYIAYSLIEKTDPLIASISIIGLLELTGALFIFSALLRLTTNKFINDYYSNNEANRLKRIISFTAGLIFLIILLGGLARYDINVVRALRSFNDSMAKVATDVSLEDRLPMETVLGFRSHLGTPYQIYPRPDTKAVGNYVFSVTFIDGFSLSCRVSVTELRQDFYFNVCSQGADLSFP